MDDLDWFNERFEAELDSAFTADIACCDHCYEEFVKRWPAAYLRDIRFQQSAIDLGVFYSNSRLQLEFSAEEFWNFVRQLGCPQCGHSLDGTIWPYNLPFSSPKDFEKNAAEIAELAQRTPFLVLRHPLAREILDAITKNARIAKPQYLEAPYFRGRLANGLVRSDLDSFLRPPATKCNEGRFNHAGAPVLYLASDPTTCIKEIGSPACDVILAEISVSSPLKILDLLEPQSVGFEDEILSALVHSSLVSAPRQSDGWDRPEYVVSRFVADCARDVGFQAIKYPSVRCAEGHNLVILSQEPPEVLGIRIVSLHEVPEGSDASSAGS